jgi:cyclohexa-1,5-dienecarbonyl-CoA hydratase
LNVSTVRTEHSPARLRVILDAPHGNAITDGMVGAMRDALKNAGGRERAEGRPLKLVTIEAAGSDFSFGASIEEHAPDRMRQVLPQFHALIVELLRVPAVTAAVVSGRCLGGGFELALACDVIFAASDAVMGLPEIAIGAFPPVGSILLPLKVGAARASATILTGEARPAGEWQALGLVQNVIPRDQLAAAVNQWYAASVERHSAAALQRAALASRLVVIRSVDALLPQVERLYLDDLLTTSDAAEGIAAFVEKRAPRWKDA